MKYLFLHSNFPAQFWRLAVHLAARPENEVVFLAETARPDWPAPGVRLSLVTDLQPQSAKSQVQQAPHEKLLARAQQFGNAMAGLKKKGFVPDCICGHAGFACALFAPDVFPTARRVNYVEWFYNAAFPYATPPENLAQLARHRVLNLTQLELIASAHCTITPTHWQRAQFPPGLQRFIQVAHEGVDTHFFSPLAPGNDEINWDLLGLPERARSAELMTYVARGFEPCRGFPVLYRALPALLQARPQAQVVIMGNDSVSYDEPRPDGKTWLQALREEVAVDEERVHILPFMAYPAYRELLRASSLHVYLSIPYVLSWSLLEAMACGCLVAGSDTPTVRELIRPGSNGLLVPWGDPQALAQALAEILARRAEFVALPAAARKCIVSDYSLERCLPRLERLMHGG